MGEPMAKIVSIINLKGGVGKTTTTVALAEFLSFEFNKKVLVIDLDPQTNATVMLIKQSRWKDANDNNKTLKQMFLDKLNGQSLFDMKTSIVRSVSNIKQGIDKLDLLPSSVDLIELQDRLPSIGERSSFPENSITILASNLTEDIVDYYDYILIDCPPNLGTITLNGIYLSDYYLVPVIPDILSTYGIHQIISRINKCTSDIKRINRNFNIKSLGMIITKYRTQSNMHNRISDDLISRGQIGELPRVFEYKVREATRIGQVAEFDTSYSSLKQKYDYDNQIYNGFKALAAEFISRAI